MVIHQITNSYGNYNYNAFVYNDISWYTHFHANYEVIYTIEGATEITLNGEKERLEAGEIIMISPYTIHSFSSDENTKTWIGVFSEEFIASFVEKNKYARYSKFRCDSDIEEILNKYLFFEGEPEHYILISCLYMVCNECVKNAAAEEAEQNDKFIHSVIEYITENIGNEITLRGMADMLGYEYHYFSSLFHKCFSINFKSFLNIFRYEKACRLLMDRKKDITWICSECGFGSIRNFNRVFKKMNGATPSEYRNMIKASR